MYICTACGCVFEEPTHYRECLDWAVPYYEEWDGCPSCSESAYIESEGEDAYA